MKTMKMKPSCAASLVFGIAAVLLLPGCQHDTREPVTLNIDEAFAMEPTDGQLFFHRCTYGLTGRHRRFSRGDRSRPRQLWHRNFARSMR